MFKKELLNRHTLSNDKKDYNKEHRNRETEVEESQLVMKSIQDTIKSQLFLCMSSQKQKRNTNFLNNYGKVTYYHKNNI